MELFSPGHLIPLLIVAAILFFGWKQLPDMARSAGRSLRIFKSEMKGMADDDRARKAAAETSTAPTVTEAAPVAPVTPAAPPVTPAAPVVPPVAPPVDQRTQLNGQRVDAPPAPVDPTAAPHSSDT